MNSHSSEQSASVRFTTGTLHLTAVPAPTADASNGRATAMKMFEDPAGGHYRDMHHGPCAWDATGHDDEERPRE